MIPSLVVSDIRSALVEFLASTFALSDDAVRDELSSFLNHQSEGIFRGPYLSVRTPFRSVGDEWTSPLDWLPDDFVPYMHQATSFERLSTARSATASPTISGPRLSSLIAFRFPKTGKSGASGRT